MGFLSNIVKAVVKSPIGKALDATYYTIAHPIEATKGIATGTFQKKEEAFYSQPLSKQATQLVVAGIGYGTAIVGGAAIGGAAKAGTLIPAITKAVIPTTLKGAVLETGAVLVGGGIVASNPLKALDVVAKTPQGLANVGVNIGNLASNPSIENAKNLVVENPVIVGLAAAAGLAIGAKTILPALVTSRQIQATQEQTKAIEGSTKGLTSGDTSSQLQTQPYNPNIAPVPVTPQTKTITAGTTTTRRRRKSSSKSANRISQSVKISFDNDKVDNKRYIKERSH